MTAAATLRRALRLVLPPLLPVAIAATLLLYLYPVFQRCAFPLPPPHVADPRAAFLDAASRHVPFLDGEAPRAPFRLLALGDPQLEGDTSIPNAYLGVVPHLKSAAKHLSSKTQHASLRGRMRRVCHDLVDFCFEDIPNEITSLRKRLDLWGNDLYLAHVYRTMDWWAEPTHVTVLGDLVGSQWIDDAEFARRGERFWERVFKGTERVSDDLAAYPADEYDLAGFLDGSDEGLDRWRKRLINVAGNHDIGYAGDLTPARLARFERVFGKASYELRFELPVSDPVLNATIFDPETNPDSTRLVPELRIVVANDMNLDTPARSAPMQDETYAFINAVIDTGSAVEFEGHFTVVLTHIPFYKDAGTCVDAPYFDFFPADEGGGVREQHMLSYDASRGFLEGIYGLSGNPKAAGKGKGRRGIVLNGHDHSGCDTWHFVNQTNGTVGERKWEARRFRDAEREGIPGKEGYPGVREVTVRSMMGDYEGNSGLLSAWFDEEAWEWKAEYAKCRLGPHHGWWVVHVVDLVAAIAVVVLGIMEALGVGRDEADGETKVKQEDKVKVKGVAAGAKEEK